MMEIRPLHAARGRQAALHQLEACLRGRVFALVDQRGGFRMIDLEHVRLEPVTLGDGAGIGHHHSRLGVPPVDVMPE